MSKLKRIHTTLDDKTIEKINFLKEEYDIRFTNDLIKILVNTEYNLAKKRKGGNYIEFSRNE